MNTSLDKLDAHRDGIRFVTLFVVLFAALYALWTNARGTVVERIVIDVATVRPGAAIINSLTPQERVQPQGHRLVSPHARLSVLKGCEGVECLLLLVAAVLAFRAASWRERLLGLLAGIALVYALNQLRIVALFYSYRFERGWFEILHAYVAPTLIVLVAGVFFLWWVNQVAPSERRG
jgi:exosortase family protein XrtM